MPQSNFIYPLEMHSLDAGTIAIDRWDAINIAGMDGECVYFTINNNSSSNIFISWNGDDDHEYVTYYSKITLNLQLNSSPPGFVSKIKKYTTFFVRGYPDQNNGNIVLSGYFNKRI